MSRHTSLNAELHDQIVKLVGAGVAIKRAAQANGVGERTVMTWLSRGRADEAEEPYASFVEALEAARSTYQAALVMRVNGASKRDWKAAAWLLERKFPDEFGSKQKLDLNVPGALEDALKRVAGKLDEATMGKLLDALGALDGSE